MNSGFALFLAFGIGVVAGLRSMTAPAIVAWAAHLGWISLSGSHLAFMGSAWAVGIFTLGALAEFVADQLPTTPARTTAGPLAARIVMGSLTGACLGTAGGPNVSLIVEFKLFLHFLKSPKTDDDRTAGLGSPFLLNSSLINRLPAAKHP